MLIFTKTLIFTQKSRHYNSGFDIIINSESDCIRLNNHFSLSLLVSCISCCKLISESRNFTFKKISFCQILTQLPLFEKVLPLIEETSTSCHIIRTTIFHFLVGRGYRSIFAIFALPYVRREILSIPGGITTTVTTFKQS